VRRRKEKKRLRKRSKEEFVTFPRWEEDSTLNFISAITGE
jgi:hypothetical protein